MGREIAVLLSDKHAGSKLALCSPKVKLSDPNTGEEYSPPLNQVQQKFWEWYCKDRDAVLKWANGDPVTVFDVGDPTQGNRFPTELVTTSAAEQIMIAMAVSHEYLQEKNVRRLVQIAGTDVHEFGENTATVLMAQQFKKEYPHLAVKATQHGLESVAGVSFDVAHHGPTGGSRNWLKGNVLRLYTQDVMDAELAARRVPPQVLLRGHYHDYTSEVVSRRHHETRAMILPSWQWPNIHALKVAKSPLAFSTGTVALALQDGEIVGKPWVSLYIIDLRTNEARHFRSYAEKTKQVSDDY